MKWKLQALKKQKKYWAWKKSSHYQNHQIKKNCYITIDI